MGHSPLLYVSFVSVYICLDLKLCADSADGCEDWNHLSSIVFESMIQFCADTLRNPVLYQSLPSLLDIKGHSGGTRESFTLLYSLQWSQKHNFELRAHE